MSIRANVGDKSKMNAINEIEIDGVKCAVTYICRCEQNEGGTEASKANASHQMSRRLTVIKWRKVAATPLATTATIMAAANSQAVPHEARTLLLLTAVGGVFTRSAIHFKRRKKRLVKMAIVEQYVATNKG